ncbi:hypothetical protein VNI00_017639 [Paramarasmius palmivorus]|uniref:Uncharacterized protein n=1 Tax=Paramarasmius palmivorus TaxID=297713 RepID=A0AAW0B5Y5_9AGAR
MTRSDPENIARLRVQGNLHITGEEEQAWMRQKWPHLSEEHFHDMTISRQQRRRELNKREREHARYLRNRDQRKAAAALRIQRKMEAFKDDVDALEKFKEAHRNAQGRYHQRNKEQINAKARIRRSEAMKKARDNIAQNIPACNPPTMPLEDSGRSSVDDGLSTEPNETDDASRSSNLDIPGEGLKKAVGVHLDGGDASGGADPMASSSTNNADTGAWQAPSRPSTGPNSNADPTPTSVTSSNQETANRRGNPGNFTGEQLQFLLDAFAEYDKLPRRSKESGDWMREFIPKFIARFPLDKYPPPSIKQMSPLEDVDVSKLSAKKLKAYKKRVAAREANERPEERLATAIRRWFYWKGGDMRKKDDESVEKFLKSMKKEAKAPRRQQKQNYLTSSEGFRKAVEEKSNETGRLDRLPSRHKAANQLWGELDEDQQQVILDDIEAKYSEALSEWKKKKEGGVEEGARDSITRRSVGRIVQPFIDVLHRRTGLSCVVFVGEDVDGQGKFDSAIMSASPPGTPKITQFNVDKFNPFIEFFYRWLRTIRQHGEEAGNSPAPEDSATSMTSSQGSGTSASASVSAQGRPDLDANTQGSIPISGISKKRRNRRKKRVGDEEETTSSDSGMGSGVGGDDDAFGEQESDYEEESEEEEPNVPQFKPAPGPYEARREENIKANRELLTKLRLDKSIFASTKPPKRPSSSKGKESGQDSVEPKRRSSRLKASALVTGERSAQDCQDPANLRADQPEIDVVNFPVEDTYDKLVTECNRFKDDQESVDVMQLCDLVMATTTEGSEARNTWIAYVSALSQAWLDKKENPLQDIAWPSLPDRNIETGCKTQDRHEPSPDDNVEERDHLAVRIGDPIPADDERGGNGDEDVQLREESNDQPRLDGINGPEQGLQMAGNELSSTKIPSSTGSSTVSPDLTEAINSSLDSMPDQIPQEHQSSSLPALELGVEGHSKSEAVVAAYATVMVSPRYTYDPGEHDSDVISWFVSYLMGKPTGYQGPDRPQLWRSLVYLWADLQESWEMVPGFKNKKAPGKPVRPICIEQWNKYGRTRSMASGAPPGATLECLRAEWWSWWSSANPPSVSRSGHFVLPATESDVKEMHMRGEHGIVLFLVVLRWWHDVGGHSDEASMWEEAVKSMYCAMDLMLKSIVETSTVSTGCKRKDLEEENMRESKVAKRSRK